VRASLENRRARGGKAALAAETVRPS